MTQNVIRLSKLAKKYLVRFNPNPSLKSKFIGLFDARYREKVDEFWALREVDLEVSRGESVGIIGPNGSGKSTLLKIVAGVLKATSGSVEVQGLIAPMIELGVGFHPELTGIENIFLNTSFFGFRRAETKKMIPEIHAFSELGEFINLPIKNYSSGMILRLAFSIGVTLAPDLLLIDEILAVGDAHFQQKCLDRMREIRRANRTILLVSHAMAQIPAMCDRVVFLHQGRVRSEGVPEDVIRDYFAEIADSSSPPLEQTV